VETGNKRLFLGTDSARKSKLLVHGGYQIQLSSSHSVGEKEDKNISTSCIADTSCLLLLVVAHDISAKKSESNKNTAAGVFTQPYALGYVR